MNASDYINEFQRVLWDKGYVMTHVRYEWRGGVSRYTVEWAPESVAPWLKHNYPVNCVFGPNPDKILAKLVQLPYHQLN